MLNDNVINRFGLFSLQNFTDLNWKQFPHGLLKYTWPYNNKILQSTEDFTSLKMSRQRSADAARFKPKYFYQFRIILIGDSTVGKSSLLRQFTEGQFIENSDPTVGVDFHVRVVMLTCEFSTILLNVCHVACQQCTSNLSSRNINYQLFYLWYNHS